METAKVSVIWRKAIISGHSRICLCGSQTESQWPRQAPPALGHRVRHFSPILRRLRYRHVQIVRRYPLHGLVEDTRADLPPRPQPDSLAAVARRQTDSYHYTRHVDFVNNGAVLREWPGKIRQE